MNIKHKEIYDEIMMAWADFERDATKAIEKGNKSAARRSRKASLKLDKLFREWRKFSTHEIG